MRAGTGASSGFGNLTACALAEAGHTVYAGMRATVDRDAPAVAALTQLRGDRGVQTAAVEMDVQDQESTDAAIHHIMTEQQRIDVVVHNAGQWFSGRPMPSPPFSSPMSTTSTCCPHSG
ncbi:SDR family NAD(P)-dependent oxidoreductase [Streptomyces altiplanensis]